MIEDDERDMLAAEYVLGTLDADERATVASRLERDADLARAVLAWEGRLAPLLARVAAVEPPSGAYAGIAAKVFGRTMPPGPPPDLALQLRLRRWRGTALGFAALAACLLAWIAAERVVSRPGRQTYLAVLQRDSGSPAMVIEVDLARRRLTVRSLAAPPPAGRAYELWIVDPSLGTPRSLGLVPAGESQRDPLRAYDPGIIAGATYAITVEPAGGSPTGQPTTNPLLLGKLRPFPP